jgi:hypothetical protein
MKESYVKKLAAHNGLAQPDGRQRHLGLASLDDKIVPHPALFLSAGPRSDIAKVTHEQLESPNWLRDFFVVGHLCRWCNWVQRWIISSSRHD